MIAWFLLFLACGSSDTESDVSEIPHVENVTSFTVNGFVYDSDGNVVPEAMVMFAGESEKMVFTDENGAYSIWFEPPEIGEPALLATKEGYRSVAADKILADSPVNITIREVKGADNIDYTYEDPGDGIQNMEENCSHCHTSFVADFLTSKHAEAASNPLLQDLYAGISRAFTSEQACQQAGGQWLLGLEPGSVDTMVEKCYIGGGVLPDLNDSCGGVDQPSCDGNALHETAHPTQFGGCADCHAPGINGIAGGRNLHDATGIEYSLGVQCDFCHKVKDIDMTKPPGAGQRMVLGRPNEPGLDITEWDQVFYGPLVDVPNAVMGGSFQPKFQESLYCAGCHEQQQPALISGDNLDSNRWPEGVDIHTTYSEWQDGPYNQEATQCQFCHMPASTEMMNSVDVARPENQSVMSGFAREMKDNRLHLFKGPLQGNPRLIDTALYVSVKTERDNHQLNATVSVGNIGCGHAVPTGEPMRAVILLVEATGECGSLEPTGGMTIPDTGGVYLSGIEGVDTETTGNTVAWENAVTIVEVGQVIRVVRPTGIYEDYRGIGLFSDAQLSPESKGMERQEPVASSVVQRIEAGKIQLANEIDIQSGDILLLGDAWPERAEDGQASLALSGKAGFAFSKVLVDAQGNRHVPHYKAVDIVSDNRIAPGTNVLTQHQFSIPENCQNGQVKATLLYRPIPLRMASERGWEAMDYIIGEGQDSW